MGEPLPSTLTLESSPSITTSTSPSTLRFKALLLDENSNAIPGHSLARSSTARLAVLPTQDRIVVKD